MATNLEMVIKRHLEGSRFFATHPPIIVATSTGVDSMVLLTLVQNLVPKERLIVAHVNHHLRSQSQVEEQFLRQYCQKHQLALRVMQWQDHPQNGIEAAARQARYHFFATIMAETKAKILLTAHHANDQAETVLMKLVRGGDLHQLVGLRPRRPFASGDLIRPLLTISKATLINYAKTKGVKWYEDETNTDLSITRNRYRHQYLPTLARENPQIINDLGQTVAQLQDWLAFAQTQLQDQLQSLISKKELDLRLWWQHSPATQRLLLQTWLQQNGVVNYKWNALVQLQQRLQQGELPNQTFALPGKWQLIRNYHLLHLENLEKLDQKPNDLRQSMVKFAHWQTVNPTQAIMVSAEQQSNLSPNQLVATVWIRSGDLPLTIRPAKLTDRLRLKNGGFQTVRRIFINQKVPVDQRQKAQVLVDQSGRVWWLIGYKTAWWDWPKETNGWQQLRFFQRKVENHE